MPKRLSLLILLPLLLLFTAKAQQRVYVNLHATGLNNGTSWVNAYTNLQTAIDSATRGSEIWVAKGVYSPTKKAYNGIIERHKSFVIDKTLKLYGGFAGTETDTIQRILSDTTVLSGQLSGTDQAFHVMIIIATHSDSITINRFTIRDGFSNGFALSDSSYIDLPDSLGITNYSIDPYGIIPNSVAAGIYIYAQNTSAIHITDNYFTNNRSINVSSNTGSNDGTMMAIAVDSAGIFVDANRFYRNDTFSGGGICMGTDGSGWITVINNMFEENSGVNGGGISVYGGEHILITNNRFIKNNVTNKGGGIYLYFSSTLLSEVVVTSNYFEENCGEIGGGLYIDLWDNVFIKLLVTDNTFYRNKAISGGGIDLYSPYNYNEVILKITNNIILENQATDKGGGGIRINLGSYIGANSNYIITNNIITRNSSMYGGGVQLTAPHTIGFLFTNNEITNNTAQWGGGVYCTSGTVIGNFIAHNSADSCGGGCYIVSSENTYPIFKNNFIWENQANNAGGVYAVSYTKGKLQLINNSLVNNTAIHTEGLHVHTEYKQWSYSYRGMALVDNNLIWNNGTNNFNQSGTGILSINNNLIEGETASYLNTFGSGNLDGTTANQAARSNLLFSDPATNDYSIKSTSTCINAGVDSLYTKNPRQGDSVDYAGKPRFHGSSIDIGAYEWHSTYVIISLPNDSAKGKTIGNGTFLLNDRDTLIATPNLGYELAFWKDTLGNIVSYNDTIMLTITGDTTVIAYFRPEGTSSDASLWSLTPSAGVLNPVFKSDRYQYTDTVPYSVDSITFYVQTTDHLALVNATDTAQKALRVGNNSFSVRVTSSDGFETAEYFIQVYRLNNNAFLHELSVSNTNVSPAFDSAHYVYTDTVLFQVTHVNIDALLSDQKAKLTGDTGLQNLTVGWNNFSLLVHAEDPDTTRLYAINIYRKLEFEDTDARLISLVINNDEQLDAPTNSYDGHYEGECGQAQFHIHITIPNGATLSIENDFVHVMNRLAGTDTITFSITSRNGTVSSSHRMVLERRLPFLGYVLVLWNYNSLMLDIERVNADGLNIEYGTHYRWYKNEEEIRGALLPTYSAGPSSSDQLQNGAYYYLQIKTLEGEWVRTCASLITYANNADPIQINGISLYPNPVQVGQEFFLNVENNNTKQLINIYDVTGKCIQKLIANQNPVTIQIPEKGVYIIEINNMTWTKVIVE